jgi:hypothetical protein
VQVGIVVGIVVAAVGHRATLGVVAAGGDGGGVAAAGWRSDIVLGTGEHMAATRGVVVVGATTWGPSTYDAACDGASWRSEVSNIYMVYGIYVWYIIVSTKRQRADACGSTGAVVGGFVGAMVVACDV